MARYITTARYVYCIFMVNLDVPRKFWVKMSKWVKTNKKQNKIINKSYKNNKIKSLEWLEWRPFNDDHHKSVPEVEGEYLHDCNNSS